MIADLKPYSEYKDSGLPWIGQVPGHWEIKRTKSSVANIVEQTTQMNSGDVYVALENIESWTGRVRPQRGENLFTGQVKRFRSEDVLFGKLRPYLAKVTRLQSTGVCVGELFVLRPRSESIHSNFLEYQLRAKHTIDVINSSTFGAKMPRADWQFLGNLPIVLPPPDEQAVIVRFLDHANRRLEKAIRAKRKVIALLNEQKQGIIHRAITCGLDPTVPLKPSGICWLGDIPKHWEVRRLKSFAANVTDQTTTMSDDEVYIALENVEGWTGLFKPQRRQDEGLFTGQVKRFQTNDVLFGKLRPYLAKVITVLSRGVCVGEFFVLRANGSLVCPLFLEQLLRTKTAIEVIDSSTFGAKMPRADWQFVGNLRIAFPPVSEQESIIKSIHVETRPLANAISRLEREIELLLEYRTRLVADVVTGKLDVREAASNVPDEAELPDTPEADAEDLDAVESEDEPVVV